MNLINKSNAKPFSKSEYDQCNDFAVTLLQKDLPRFYVHKPPENYGIDTFVYASRELFEMGDAPLFSVELEVKKSGHWGEGSYPFSTVHFLARKARLLNSRCVPFFVQYNENGTNALLLPCSYITGCTLKQMFGATSSDGTRSNDYYYDVPLEACVFGRQNLQDGILQYFANILDVAKQAVEAVPSAMMSRGNRIYNAMINIPA